MNDDWQHAPPYAHGPASFSVAHGAECFCGAVRFEVCSEPVDAKLCHCPQCQSLHGAPFQWAVLFHKRDVRFVRGVDKLFFYHAETKESGHILPCKLSCRECRTPIADEGRRMFMAFGPLFDFGVPPVVPARFRATCHIFYGARVIDIDDDLPKYLGHKGDSPLWREGDGDPPAMQ